MRPFIVDFRSVFAALIIGLGAVLPSAASDDPVNSLAGAICAAADFNSISALISQTQTENPMQPEEIAEAFGVAAFLADLGRCANRQAMADSFVLYKKGKNISALDVAFAQGRVAAKPASSASAVTGTYQGSFVALGTAGDPPSGQ